MEGECETVRMMVRNLWGKGGHQSRKITCWGGEKEKKMR